MALGAALDMHGYSCNNNNGFCGTLNIGGTGPDGNGALLNTPGGGGYTWNTGAAQNPNVNLTANTLFNLATDFGQIGSGYAPTTLALNGFTLTKTGAGGYYLLNGTVTSGSLNITGGSFGTTGVNVITITGTGMVTVGDGNGNGTLSLAGQQGANSITCPITINGGTIYNGSNNSQINVADHPQRQQRVERI